MDQPEQPPSPSSLPNTNTNTKPHPNPKFQPQLKRFLRPFASLQLAIGELALISLLCSIGTVIEQNKPYDYYAQFYPGDGPNKVLGFVTSDLIWTLQWNHIYTANYFLGLLALLALSLTACTVTNQWPAVKIAQRWQFRRQEKAYTSLPFAKKVPSAHVRDLARSLDTKDYQVFVHNDGALYAFKGLAGRLGPIGVHASMLAVMAGVVLGAVGGYTGSVMIPEGGDLLVASALQPASPLARLPPGGQAVLHVDNFDIDYRPDGSVRQFKTDIVVEDVDGRQLSAQKMEVNRPLRFGGVTAYQTDWSMAALTIRAPNTPLSPPDGQPLKLPMASLEDSKGGSAGKLYAAFLPLADPTYDDTSSTRKKAPKGISFIARDLQSVVVYDSQGKFVGVRRPGSGKPIAVEGVDVVVDGIVGSSGLEMKVDPGVPLVYAGFGGMMVTTVLSYVSHSQVWAAQVGGDVVVGGRTNRAKVLFEQELDRVVEGLPERVG